MAQDTSSIFALSGRDNITAEEHFGIKGFRLTTSVPYRDVLSVRGLWAPPYASADFVLEVRLDGEKVPTEDYLWNGNECRRQGWLRDLKVESSLVVPLERRCGLLEFTVTNTGPAAVTVPVQLVVRGSVDYVSFWEFAGPGTSEANAPWAERARGWTVDPEQPNVGGPPVRLAKRKEAGAVALATDLEMSRWETLCGHWESSLTLAAGQARTVRVVFALGPADAVADDCRDMLDAAQDVVAAARQEWAGQVEELFIRLPHLEASDPRLVRFYNRSLVHLILNQWRVPEFVVNPYYSTGGINGGCVCCYLWDFGEPWEMLPLYDPGALKAHIRQFLSLDLTKHFAFVPVTGEAFGPWYPVNQEKIIFLIYHLVLLTGDRDFLHEQVAGKTILQWVLFHATYRDHPQLPVSLIDYGKGNNHLELRGTYRYDNYLPDLNARRYGNYLAAYELSRLAGCAAVAGTPSEELLSRAETLKGLIKQVMWSPEHRWFFHLDENFNPDLRFNVQLFKLIGSPVLDDEELEGLLSHLNEEEFLSAYGLHSMSKLDPAYDQVDIDNGGGGNYTAFTPQVIERLYQVGRPDLAEDILRRVLWWGERLPYWGDSLVANNIDYRRDTPLQNTIGAVAGAQCLIFGMFGVRVSPEGAITIKPQPPSFSPELRLTGLRLRGRSLDISVAGGSYTVTVDGSATTSALGTPTVVPPATPGGGQAQ